jgi:hypothetical protein
MGEIAARTVLDRIEGRAEYVAEIAIEPQFIVRESTAPAPALRKRPLHSGTEHASLPAQ